MTVRPERSRQRGGPPSATSSIEALKDLTDIQTSLGFPQVLTEQNAVARLASSHLLERGFKQFGFCGFSGHDWSRRRRDGFIRSIADAGFSCAIYESPWNTARQGSWEK